MDVKELDSLTKQLNDSRNQDLAWYDYGFDMAKGAWSGAVDAAEETWQFTRWSADALADGAGYLMGQEWGGIDGNTWDENYETERLLFEPPRPTTAAGQVVDDITQFGVGLIGAGKFTAATKAGKYLAKKGTKGKIAKTTVDSAISATVAHNPYEQRLSDIVQDIPALQNPVTDFLQSDEDDSLLERRLKMAGEDIALGIGIEGVLAFARAAKRLRKGEDPQTVQTDLESELAKSTEKAKRQRTTAQKKRSADVQAAKREQKRIDAAADKGEDITNMPRERTAAVMADDIEIAANKQGKGRDDFLMGEKKADLMERARLLGIPTSKRTTKAQIVEKIEARLFPDGQKVNPVNKVEVKATKGDSGVQKPKSVGVKPTKAQIQALTKGVKEPEDIQTVFNETTGFKLFNRTKDGDMPIVNYVDEVTSVLQDTINNTKPMLDRVRGKQGVDDVFKKVATRLSETTGLKADDWMNKAYAYGKTTEEAMVVLHAVESLLKDSGERMYKLFSDRRYGSNQEVQEKALAELENYNKLLAAAQMIETPIGRALRMRQEKVFDSKALDAAVKEMGGRENLERFRAAVIASGGDFSKIGRAAAEMPRIKKGGAMLGEFFRSMILFNIKTHVTNTLSGMTETFLVPMERYIGSYIPYGRNPFGAEAKAVRDDVTYHLMGLSSSFKDSISIAAQALRMEKNFLDPANTKLDGTDVVNKISSDFVGIRGDTLLGRNLDTIGKISRGSLRALGAEDEFFKQINYRARVFADAYREGKTLMDAGKLKDADAVKDYAVKKVSEAFDDAGRGSNEGAVQYAREITFTEELRDGSVALKFQQFTQQHPTAQLFLPFIRTPTNLIVRGVQRTPLGAMLSRTYRETLRHGSPAEKAQMLGRITLGTTFLGGMAMYAMEGRITGAGPALPDQNKLWRAAGNQPYSILVNGKWVSYNRMDPLFMPIGLMANFFDMSKHLSANERDDLFATSVFAMSRTIQDKAYLQGIANFVDALQTDDPRTLAKVSSFRDNFVASFIPSAPLQVVEGIQALSDDEGNYPELREAVGLADKMMRRIPFMVDELPKKYNWLTGEAIRNPDAFSTGFPIVPDKTTEFVGSELVNLKYPFQGPQRRIEGVELSSEQLADYHQFMGTTTINGMSLMQSLSRLMRDPNYRKDGSQAYDGEIQTREIQAVTQILGAYKQQARVELYQKYPELYREIRARKINDRAGTRLLETNR